MKASPYRYAAVRPELPAIESWAPYLTPSYQANWFTNFGPVSRQFEARLKAAWGFNSSTFVATSSATAGLAAALIAKNIAGPVVVSAFTFPATLSSIKMAGCTPLVVDVSEADWRVSAATLSRALASTRAKAAILVSPFGFKTDYAEHLEIAQRHGATLIIDNAAGLGVERAMVEEFRNVFEVYSLHATKPFGIGEGGVIVGNLAHEAALRSALNFGLPTALAGAEPHWGINGKLSEMHAAVGLAVLETFEARLKLRRQLAKRYIDALSPFEVVSVLRDTEASAWQVFPLLMPNERAATRLVEEGARMGMEIRRYYRPSLSQWPEALAWEPCHVAEGLSQRMCCLPVYSKAPQTETSEMIEIVKKALEFALSKN